MKDFACARCGKRRASTGDTLCYKCRLEWYGYLCRKEFSDPRHTSVPHDEFISLLFTDFLKEGIGKPEVVQFT